MESTLRPLGIVKEVIEALKLELTYAYDDLVFVEHSAFMFRFTDTSDTVEVLFNTECPQDEMKRLSAAIGQQGVQRGLRITSAGRFTLTGNDDETFSITFS